MSVVLGEVTFRYPGSDAPALDGASLSADGGVTLVTGALGAGASTLLLVAAGSAPHVTGGERRGVVRTLDHDPATSAGRAALAGRVGLLLSTPWTQLSGLATTVWDEVAFGPANLGWDRGRVGKAVDRVLGRFHLAALGARDPRTLSGGELARLMLAATVVMEPDVYLFDEPTLELDPAGAAEVTQLLPALARHATVLVASADVDRLAPVADRAVLLERGRVVADGAPAEVLGDPRAVVAGCGTTVAEIARAAGLAAPYPLTVAAALRRVGR